MNRTTGRGEAIYVRQSKDKKDSLSIKGQTELCRHECSRPAAAKVYEDRGFSGKNTMRPGFQSMLKDVRAGKISKIVVYRLDRLSRSIIDFGQLWSELEAHRVEFVSVNEKFDTATPMGRAMLYIIMVFAQLERETIGERVTDNYYTRIRDGNWPGGPAPYGMANIKIKNENGNTVPSLDYTEEFAVVKEIFYRYALDDISLGALAANLTERQIPCKNRAAWDNVALSRILHSPVYVQADAKIYGYYQSRGVNRFSNAPESFDGTCSAHVVGKRTGNTRKYTDLQNQVVSLTNFPGKDPLRYLARLPVQAGGKPTDRQCRKRKAYLAVRAVKMREMRLQPDREGRKEQKVSILQWKGQSPSLRETIFWPGGGGHRICGSA